jgi:hypothetical protein
VRVRTLIKVPVSPLHGIVEGAVFDVEKPRNRKEREQARRGVWITAPQTKERVLLLSHEFEVVEASTTPRKEPGHG